MQTTSQILNAGQTLAIAEVGAYFQIFESYAPVTVRFMINGKVLMTAEDMEAGFYASPGDGFDRVELTSATQQKVKIGISDGSGGTNRMTGNVNATIQTASSVLNRAIVNVGTVETPLMAQRSDRYGFRVLNSGATNIAIGGPGVTYATAVIVLAAGEVWNEETAPGAAWVAISDAAGGVLKAMELIA
ncbi:hypothetical protein DLM_1780 [Aquitalea magnusonii]|uniref:Phage protein n=1 Tax=Aquitalea magnusonii TaxID=332411 RepID=A0A3G9GJ19_9NEIS|nr:hypothetical protein [Aquitalea magnusonii]BBF85396.1 hypothetical protein DLM_1780 [Aquitalea magnusonii]